ncbi:hypothetical protein Pd630_LPD07199 [Rhodococcus opacus PD630]|nr:hypothetical protein Pd630_LPD07199 [Rhodococcus opacus PD630]
MGRRSLFQLSRSPSLDGHLFRTYGLDSGSAIQTPAGSRTRYTLISVSLGSRSPLH